MRELGELSITVAPRAFEPFACECCGCAHDPYPKLAPTLFAGAAN